MQSLPRHLRTVLIFSTLFTSCGKVEGYRFNQNVVETETALTPAIKETEAKVAAYVNAGHFDSVALAGALMERRFDTAIQKVQHLTAPDKKEAAAFQRSFVSYLRFFKGIYSGYRAMGEATEEQRPEVVTSLMQVIRGKDSVITSMQAVQKRFADAYGFKLQ